MMAENNVTVVDNEGFRDLVETMTSSISATRESIKKISTQLDTDTKNGISLLSLKHHLMLSYCQALVLLSAHRVLGHTSTDRTSDSAGQQKPFSSTERDPRGSRAGDLVDSMIENRIVFEKVRALESKMRYQIEKLVRLAEEEPQDGDKNVVNDPLVFRPNPQNLMNQDGDSSVSDVSDSEESGSEAEQSRTGIYRPPKLAPMPYTEDSAKRKDKSRKPPPAPSALSQLSYLNPHVESSSGLGNIPTLQSARAKELARLTEFEEENFTRLVMKKSEEKRRKRDEEAIALGGTGADLAPGARGRGRRGYGLEDEFADVLKSVGRRKESVVGDGYEELRQRGKKVDVLSRARARSQGDAEGDSAGPTRKKGRFERDQAALKKVLKRKTQKGKKR